jgi:hypothetical protein
MRIGTLAAAVALGFASISGAQTPTPAGGEFRVNTFTASEQKHAQVAVGPRGDFLIVWSSLNQDGDSFGVFGKRYDALGTPQGGEFQVSTTNFGYQYATGVAADAGGNYIVVWFATGVDGSGRGIVGRVLSPTGVPLTGDFRVNAFGAGRQTVPSVAAQPGGGFVVVWESYAQDGSSYGIIGRRFDSRGNPLTGDFLVNAFTPGAQNAPKITSDAAGNFVVVWHSNGQDGSATGVFGRRFNAAAAPVSGDFQVNVYTSNHQQYPVVSAIADGRFTVAWESGNNVGGPTQDGNNYGSYARRYDAAGNPLSGDLQTNVYTVDHQRTPTVTTFGNGSFLAAWNSQDQLTPFPNRDIFARQFNAAGSPGPEFLVNQFTTADQFQAHADADEVGNIVVAWDSINQDGSLNGVYARRYGGLVPFGLTVDANANPSANGNRVFESGELVVVQPSWRNVNGATLFFDGFASGFTGPVGPAYTIADANAGYGSVPSGSIGNCGAGAGCYALRILAGARPAAHWDAQFREDIAPAPAQSKVWTVHIGDSFTDVPRTNGFYRFVETVFHTGAMPGCAPGQFCPFTNVPRHEMAQFVLKGREPHFVPPACVPGAEMFADVPAASASCRWVEELARRGVVGGCSPGLYCPNAGVTRQELAVFLLATLQPGFVPPACGVPVFNDVPASSSFCRWIEELQRRGVVTGCGGGNYCPTLPVARDQMSVFLTVTFGLSLYGP